EQGLERPQFVQKIPGFRIGGPIFKNKTFFFTNFQWLSTLKTTLNTNTVYTSQARNGIFRYVDQNLSNCGGCTNASAVDSSGNPLPGVVLANYDVAANDPAGLGLDSNVQQVLNSMPLPNNFSQGDGVNIAGFSWLAAEHEKQLDYTVRIDHTFNTNHS